MLLFFAGGWSLYLLPKSPHFIQLKAAKYMTIAMCVTRECRVCSKHYPPNKFPKGRTECKPCNSKRKMEERKRHPLKYAYKMQKDGAKQRGIDWRFTFDSWVEWWGEDFDRRGRSKGSLVMARFGDVGPYHPHNCFKATHSENQQDRGSQ